MSSIEQPLDGIPTSIAGVTHDNDDGTSRQKVLAYCRKHNIQLLQLIREPSNKWDPNAVRVEATAVSTEDPNKTKSIQLGYIRNRRFQCLTCGNVYEPNPGEKIPTKCECGSIEFDREGLATKIARAMDQGVKYVATVLQYTGGDGVGSDGKAKNLGCNIRLEIMPETEPSMKRK